MDPKEIKIELEDLQRQKEELFVDMIKDGYPRDYLESVWMSLGCEANNILRRI